MKGNLKVILAVLAILVVGGSFIVFKPAQEDKFIIMATTTSTQDSGLLDYLLPYFTEETGIEVRVVAAGTGKALQIGKDGQADVLLVHAKADEEAFVKEGFGVQRFDVMYNDFIVLGPKGDPISGEMKALKDVKAIMKQIQDKQLTFVSRGDDSGTHKKELKLWPTDSLTGKWYISAGKGMGDVLQMANEMEAFTLSDRATYLSMSDKLDLEIVSEGDSSLLNYYGVIAVNPKLNAAIHGKEAEQFVQWILSAKTQELIGKFGVDTYGQSLFYPNAK